MNEPTEATPADVLTLFKLLANEERIKIAAQIIDRPRTAEEIASATGLAPRLIGRHLAMLTHAGLAQEEGPKGHPTYRFRRQPLLDALRSATAQSPGVAMDDDLDAFDRRVLSTFLVNGKLTSIPAQQKKRDVILRFLAERFEPDRMYDEREVNTLVREYHDDVASWRRYMVDGGFLRRQIVRIVALDALTEGNAQVEHQISYWKPSEEG